MKATKLLAAAACLIGFAALSYAGPSPQFWNQQEMIRKENAQARAKVDAPAKTPPAPQVAACGNCGCATMKKS